ncbi:MAG: hypothetical protein JOZ62_05985 [Acidobacteriaceae bacterium]|nr:hypothetical protein [Acidobacteriaceae bacterium]
MTSESETMQACVERILQSGTFRNAPSSRRLLKYLGDHSLEGDAEQLKEYSIGVDAFGKAVGYDPRQDSTVRIQIGRLRQKLVEYYQSEGKDDPVVLDLPRGRFGLTIEQRLVSPAPSSVEVRDSAVLPQSATSRNRWRMAAFLLAGACLLTLALAVYRHPAWPSLQNANRRDSLLWSAELADLWQPFVNTGQPLIIAVGNPLFVQFENKAVYRELSIENAQDLLKSANVGAIARALGSHESRAVHYYAAIGEVTAAFLLGQRLGAQQPRMSLVPSSQLQWQELAGANVLFLGPPRFFADKLTGLPVSLEITEATQGFQIVHPRPGEPAIFKFRDPPGFFADDGEACVLVTCAPGPVGNTNVMTFASNSTFARAGAVAALTDPAFARMLTARLRESSGHMPQYFQVLLRVKYKGGVPTDVVYLLHREIRRRT